MFFRNNKQARDLRQVIHFLEIHLAEFQGKQADVSKNTFDVTIFLLEEVIDLYRSIATLYKQNHYRSCAILSRSILENSINLRYLHAENSEQKAKDFILFSIQEYTERISSIKNIPKKYAEVTATLKGVARQYDSSGKKKYYWGGKTLKQKAVNLKLNSAYSLYRHLCNYSHSKFQHNRDLSLDRPYTEYIRNIIFTDVLVHTISSLQIVCEQYDMNGGVIVIDGYFSDGKTLIFDTNTKK